MKKEKRYKRFAVECRKKTDPAIGWEAWFEDKRDVIYARNEDDALAIAHTRSRAFFEEESLPTYDYNEDWLLRVVEEK